MCENSEIWDLYDKDRNKLDKTVKRGDEIPKGFYHLAVNICLFNKNGEMLIQQRSSNKSKCANLWDTTARGSALKGEMSSIAVLRELEEELGIILKEEDINLIVSIFGNNWFGDFYIATCDLDIEKLVLLENEVQAVKWASENEIIDMIENGTFVDYSKHFVQYIFEKFRFLNMEIV